MSTEELVVAAEAEEILRVLMEVVGSGATITLKQVDRASTRFNVLCLFEDGRAAAAWGDSWPEFVHALYLLLTKTPDDDEVYEAQA